MLRRILTPVLLPAALLLAACGTHSSQSPDLASLEYESFGEAVTPEDAMPVEAALAEAEAVETEVPVKLTGVVREVCQNRGCWMTLDSGDGPDLRITFRDYGFFVPKDISGRRVVLAGTLRQEEVSVDMLRHFAEESGKSEAEIEAITEPELQFSVIADGVLVEVPADTETAS